MSQTIEHDRTEERKNVWKRGLIMLLFMIAFAFAEAVLAILTLVQFVWLLVTGEANRFIYDFGNSLSKWIAQVVRFQTCVTDEKPFPWESWPSANGVGNQPDLFEDTGDD